MESKQDELLDLVIIGAAAAGCAAAVYAARRNLNFIVVAKDIGGEVALSGEVENWPGIIHTNGYELAQNFYKHAKSYDVQFDEGFEVTEIKQETNIHIVKIKNASEETKLYRTKSVIVASGIHPRRLSILGEDKLDHKGVTYCTVCDGPLFKEKITATIGAGNAALESALMMGGIAKKVYLVTKYPENKHSGFPKGEDILIEKIKELKNIEIIYSANTTEILGTDKVEGLKYEQDSESKQIDVQGVMIHIGMIPNSKFVVCTEKNPPGEIIVDAKCTTSCTGVFAAGDVTNIAYKQIGIATGQGITAALSAIDYINRWKSKE